MVADLRQEIAKGRFPYGPAGTYKLWTEKDTEMCLKWRQLSKPLIGGVKGFCVYHAWAVCSVCDILLCAEDAKIMPFIVFY